MGINNEVVKSVIALIINNGLDKETLNSYLIGTLINQLKYPDARIIAINQCKQLKAELESSKPVRKKYSDSSDYQYREKNDILVEIVFCLNIKLGEYEEAIRYFKKNLSKQRDNEVALYLLLELLMEFELKDCWLSEYNKAVAKGVQPREDLIKTNQYILENDAMPEYILWND